ncbi:unnamed protein product, partial [Rangifer tarandus platyrhynchus]
GSLSLFPAPPICSYLCNKEDDSTATQSQVTNALSIQSTPRPRPPRKLPEWLVSSFSCAPMSLPCPSSSAGRSGRGNMPQLDRGKGSEYCECTCTFLYLASCSSNASSNSPGPPMRAVAVAAAGFPTASAAAAGSSVQQALSSSEGAEARPAKPRQKADMARAPSPQRCGPAGARQAAGGRGPAAPPRAPRLASRRGTRPSAPGAAAAAATAAAAGAEAAAPP